MIYRMIEEINKSLENGCYLVALMSALALPDICGKVEFPEMEKQTKQRYIKWYDEHIGQYEHDPGDIEDVMPYPDGKMIYDLRCALFHSGNPIVNLKKQNLVGFELWMTKDYMSGGGSSYCHSTGERKIEIGIWNICFKLCALAKYYYEHNKDKFHFNYTIKDMRDYGI